MTNISHGAKLATIESHCLYAEERSETFSEHFKAALKGFLEVTPKGAQVISQNCGIVSESVIKWSKGEATLHHDMAKDVCVVMRNYIAR